MHRCLSLIRSYRTGWWWADPVAGLMMIPMAAKEGVESPMANHVAAGLDATTPGHRVSGNDQLRNTASTFIALFNIASVMSATKRSRNINVAGF